MKKKIIILAKSDKNKEYCIAGIDYNTGEWIRCVSEDKDIEGAVPKEHAVCEDGREAEVLDVVEIEFIKPKPEPAQKENWVYDPNVRWKRTGKVSLEKVVKIQTKTGNKDDCEEIFYSTDRKISPSRAEGRSLALLKAEDPVISIEKGENGKTYRFSFTYNGKRYERFSIGDPLVKNAYKDESEGYIDKLSEPVYATFSLTVLFEGQHYKMLAHLFR